MEKETNLEHYKKRLQRIVKDYFEHPKQVFGSIQQYIDPEIKHNHEAYTDDILEWMAHEYKGEILDYAEKRYLSEVIRPFREEVKDLMKIGGPQRGQDFIRIQVGFNYLNFPGFEKGKMYKGMEYNKAYTPEDLGL